ncbi:MAG: hypothetical protein RR218_08670 [Gordonibacter sp.]
MDEEKTATVTDEEAELLQRAVEAGRTDGDGPEDVEVPDNGE